MCSQTGGAMKEFVDMPNHWVHLTCVAAFYELSPLGTFIILIINDE